jgi:hypothetical protein
MGRYRPGFLTTRDLDTWKGKPDAVLVKGLLDQGQGPAADDKLLAGFGHHLRDAVPGARLRGARFGTLVVQVASIVARQGASSRMVELTTWSLH